MVETREYIQGWNASNGGNTTIFSCPYLSGEKYNEWIKGWKDNVKAWNSDSYCLPKNK